MAKLPSVLILTGDNSEIERFLKSLVSNGLAENTLRRYSSEKIDLSILGELVLALQEAQDEVERLAPEVERLRNCTKMAEVTALKERIGVLEYSLEEVQATNGLLKNKLRGVLEKYLYAKGVGNDKFIGEVEALLEAT